MEMHLQPLATTCFVSGEAFVDGARVASYLVRNAAMEIVRYDVLEPHAAGFAPDGFVACKWVHPYKPRRSGENPDRALKLTAESLFTALADPTTEPTPENTRLVQFLALMLERKKILRPRGRSADGARNRYEHAKTKHIFEVPVGELTPEFFVAVQEQLSVLVGAPKAKGAAEGKGGESKAKADEPAAKASEPAEEEKSSEPVGEAPQGSASHEPVAEASQDAADNQPAEPATEAPQEPEINESVDATAAPAAPEAAQESETSEAAAEPGANEPVAEAPQAIEAMQEAAADLTVVEAPQEEQADDPVAEAPQEPETGEPVVEISPEAETAEEAKAAGPETEAEVAERENSPAS